MHWLCSTIQISPTSNNIPATGSSAGRAARTSSRARPPLHPPTTPEHRARARTSSSTSSWPQLDPTPGPLALWAYPRHADLPPCLCTSCHRAADVPSAQRLPSPGRPGSTPGPAGGQLADLDDSPPQTPSVTRHNPQI
mmetsp:Transcript_34651/g.87706  ORF Transcript_34651/g.87706 Transcript_34651/m.87706 type:complete len:138 (-) Transcript_34651:1454-1867(-)